MTFGFEISKLANIPVPNKFSATRDFSVGTQYFALQGSKLELPIYFRFSVNGMLYPKTPKPVEKLGTWVLHKWKNDSPAPHPIHVHGFRFVVLKRNGIDVPIASWKDTAELPPFGSLEYAVHFDGYPGEWLYHCHFESHMEGGFMGSVIVTDENGKYPPSHADAQHHGH